MRPFPLSVQLYSVREETKSDLMGTLRRIGRMGYHGVEFAGYQGHPLKEIRKVLDEAKLTVSSVHGGVPDKNNLAEIVDAAGILGFTRYVTGKRAVDFATLEDTQRSIDQFEAGAQLLKEKGMQLGIHNHGYEFDKRFNGRLPHEILMEKAPTVFAQIDTYWTALAGSDPSAAIRRCKGRVPLIHIKDGPLEKGKNMTAVGEGRMVWPPIIETAEAAGTEWLIVELDYCDTDMMEAVKKSRDFMVSKGWAVKKGDKK